MNRLSRRDLLAAGAALGTSSLLPRPAAANQPIVSHGYSTFGELAYGADFKHFSYVNPAAPKGGAIVMQIRRAVGNQAFDTFNTFNIWVLKGDGAAGMSAVFDTLMTSSGDDPDGMYGLVARSVSYTPDKLDFTFGLRPEARFHDGSKLTAADAAFSFKVLKEKGHPRFRLLLNHLVAAEARDDHTLHVRLAPERGRELPLIVAGLPIFSAAYWKNRDFEAALTEPPLGSGAYKVGRFEFGRFVEFERVAEYWGRDLPVNVGTNNFDRVRWEYYRDREVAFEAFKSGQITYHEEYTSRIWATGYDFAARREGRVKREELDSGEPAGVQGWHFNLRRPQFKDRRIREALALVMDFEWINKNIMYSSYRRLTSYFENSDMKATGKPSAEELALLEPFRQTLHPEVFGEPHVPPVSDGSGQDRALLRQANELLRAAGCERKGNTMSLPNGQPFVLEFLDYNPALLPHTQAFQKNLKLLGIDARVRSVDATQYQRRMESFDFDITMRAMGGATTPGESLKLLFSSQAARANGSPNIGGIADPAVDALLERIAQAKSRADLNIACRALDRVLRAGRFSVFAWFKRGSWVAHWDVFARPERQPKYGTGAPDTWWYDEAKAKRIGR
jgi:microcin C transport system substrate-binding protein